MTTQHSDPPRERTDKGSEVLSDATDLDSLLEAILGDQAAPLPAQVRPSDEATRRTVAAGARPQPAVVVPLRTGVDQDDAFALPLGATADHKAEWKFGSEAAEDRNETAHDVGAASPVVPAFLFPPVSQPWRDRLRASLSKRSLIVAALSATALIIASAILLREARTETASLPSSDAPALVQGSSPVEPPSAPKATDPSEVEVWAAAREPKEQPRVASRTPPRRTNEVTDQRPNPPAKPIIGEAPQSALTASPVVASPAAVERVGEPTNRDAAPSRTAPPEGEQRRLNESAATDTANGASVTNEAAPAPTAAAPPVPAGLPRQTAPRLLTDSAPEYPAALRTARIGGSVEVRFTIDRSGRVTNVQSVSGPPPLRAAAEAAVRRRRYEAARVDNLAVETQTSIRFNFDPRRPQE